MPESPIRKLVPYAEIAKKKGHKVYHLNIGQPDIKTPEVAMNSIKNLNIKVLEYSHSAGFESYRTKLSQFYKNIGLPIDVADIIITTGGSEALLFAMGSTMDFGDEVIIPEPFYANYNGFSTASGVKVVPVISSIDTGFIRKYPTLTAANQGIDQQLRIRNVVFKGNNNMGLYISSNYGMKIEGCRFYDFSTALDLRWCMGTIIDQCYFWENYIGINLDYDRFTGGSNSASQSNHSIVQNSKFRNSAGDFANIRVYAASGIHILHNIFEGVQAGGDYDVYFDDNSSTVVKEVTIYGNHVEHAPAIAAFYIRLKEGFAYCGGIYSQYNCTLIKFESIGYAKCLVENIPYLTSGTKFDNVAASGRWWFTNMPVAFDPNITTYWLNGISPINSRLDNWNSNGQSPFLQLGTRRP